jgi:sugar phosphate isomerase/epimerase
MKKNQYPFRLGCTSYVYPDDILPNVRKMAPLVDDIEIILFESDTSSNMPDQSVVQELSHLAEVHEITYTIHFPIDLKAGSIHEEQRREFACQVEKIINLTKPIDPFGYILHFEGIDRSASPERQKEWKKAILETCDRVESISWLDKSKICVESLGYPIDWHKPIVDQYGFSYCLDMGHLWMHEFDWEAECEKYVSKTRVIHLHGVSEGKDHISLKKGKMEILTRFANTCLRGYLNVVTLELFSQLETFESFEILEHIWGK